VIGNIGVGANSVIHDSLSNDMETFWSPACVQPDQCQRNSICPLSRVKAGTTVRIKQLVASPETAQRLREIGFCEEQIIKLLTAQANVICQVCNARLGIGSQLAEAILVEPMPLTRAA
jgi:Fe2+ transport system protein FeoA